MNTMVVHLKEILQEYKNDLMDLLIVGIPSGILSIWVGQFMDYSHLY
jgi:hypothetical protein